MVGERLPWSPTRPLGADAVTALCAFLVVLLGIPSGLIVSQLGSMGSPATLFGLLALMWWCWHHIHRPTATTVGVQPVRWALAIFMLLVLMSYIRAMTLPISGDEISPADSAFLRLSGLAGIALLANDGIRDSQRMHTLVRFLIVGGTLVALLSMVQFFTGEIWVDRLEIPGLSRNLALDLGSRQGLARPSGTASHPIEFATLVSLVVPIAIMDAKGRDPARLRHLIPVVVLVLGVALSLSRTAIVCVGLALVLIFPALPKAWRWGGAIAALILAGVLYVAVPGMVGTLRGLFLGITDDPSVLSRTDAYAIAGEFLARSPLIGRGLGTFLPKYWIVDNMYLQLLVEIGLVGVCAILGLFVTAIVCAWRARRLFPSGRDRDLATGLMASLAAGATSFAFFDALSFQQAAYCMFLLVGMAGAMWRLARQQGSTSQLHAPRSEVLSRSATGLDGHSSIDTDQTPGDD